MGVGDGLGAVVQAGLAEQVVDVGLDGGLGDVEPRGDLGVGEAGCNECEDLVLSGGGRPAAGSCLRRLSAVASMMPVSWC